ncbi:hypothetical protein DX980_20085 [Burkholderia gladioli]|uniref:hypothetical protein n=1 Tax=Burkholderia gladioli TaxID=28095 RepID=UPI001364D948|nr:hypothetical protein [Burkholderia gladioli]KAF1065253.1 hypothetical protein LvStA_03928 [Burkholderia gladioli]WAG21347.1 hypothetical protein DX980_20085 [Burkholderia gladioli]
MTVAELIEELQQFPPHHVVQVAIDNDETEFAWPPRTEELSVGNVRAGNSGEVVIDRTDPTSF